MFRFSRLVAIAVLLVMLAVATFLIYAFVFRQKPAEQRLTNDLWLSYLKNQWLSEGRTVSASAGSVTTSESQGYTMLRSVWENNQAVFKKTWTWTKGNLGRSDGLFSWEWGHRSNGSYGILYSSGGQNTASDGDCDIALALIMASRRWNNQLYLNSAKTIVKAIWHTEVVRVNSLYWLAADNIEKNASTAYIVINPSYFQPAVFSDFAKVDPSDAWSQLASDSIKELHEVSVATLGSGSSAGLPPDWASVNRTSGAVAPAPAAGLDTSFGFNAFRSVWNLALDYQWFGNAQAKNVLQGFSFLNTQWNSQHRLLAIYSHSGTPAAGYSSYALYGGVLGYFQYIHPEVAAALIKQAITQPLLGSNGLKSNVNYYDNNWLWFGLRLYEHKLPNLAGGAS